jgi:hypothetical protein
MKKILVFLAIILNIRVDDKCTIISAEQIVSQESLGQGPRRHRKFAARKRCEIPLVTIQKTCVLMGTHHCHTELHKEEKNQELLFANKKKCRENKRYWKK